MEFQNWRSFSLKQRGHEFSDIFSEPIVWLGLGLIPQSHSHSKPNLPVQAILIHSRQTMGLWANTPHAHLGKWPPAAVGFMTVIANESDLTYSSINQLIKWWQKKLLIILKNLEGSSHDSFWIYSFRQTADWNSYQIRSGLRDIRTSSRAETS